MQEARFHLPLGVLHTTSLWRNTEKPTLWCRAARVKDFKRKMLPSPAQTLFFACTFYTLIAKVYGGEARQKVHGGPVREPSGLKSSP